VKTCGLSSAQVLERFRRKSRRTAVGSHEQNGAGGTVLRDFAEHWSVFPTGQIAAAFAFFTQPRAAVPGAAGTRGAAQVAGRAARPLRIPQAARRHAQAAELGRMVSFNSP